MTDENLPPVPPEPSAAPVPPAPPAASVPPAAPAAPAATPYVAPAAGPSKVLSLVGMILGIVGAFFSLFGGWGFLFSIAAIVLGFLGRNREGQPARGFWLTALITGFVGIAISIIWLIVYIAIGIAAANYSVNYGN
ncbi:MAG: hypothetical protein JWN36_2290 [Microbacteriaceae bacterium]|jgi:hypothetical protein|nr:hypothetical protein [Microbacteriaceae bacterium]